MVRHHTYENILHTYYDRRNVFKKWTNRNSILNRKSCVKQVEYWCPNADKNSPFKVEQFTSDKLSIRIV